MFDTIRRVWNGFFFAPDLPTNLAVCRILFYGGLLLLKANTDYVAYAEIDEVFWMPEQCWPFAMFGIPRLPPMAMGVVAAIWKLSLLMCCVGLGFRYAAWMAFIGGFYLLGIPHCLGNLSHGDAAVVITLAILTITRSTDALSLDQRLGWTRSLGCHFEYRWPVRAIWCLLSTVFFAAGYAKMVNGGPSWVFSDNMNYILIEHQFPREHPEALIGLGAWLARQPMLPQLMAAATILLELGYPLSLFSRLARWIFVPSMVFAVIGFRVLLGPEFFPLVLLHLFWIRYTPEPASDVATADDADSDVAVTVVAASDVAASDVAAAP